MRTQDNEITRGRIHVVNSRDSCGASEVHRQEVIINHFPSKDNSSLGAEAARRCEYCNHIIGSIDAGECNNRVIISLTNRGAIEKARKLNVCDCLCHQ